MDKANLKVSVIIPVYNGEKFLKNTLDSIINSTYKNMEIIIVDDGSTDKSRKICLEYSNIDSRIVYFFKNNKGIVSSRNYGLEKATGDFICFCDQDDIVDKNMYKRMLDIINLNNSEICICSTGRIREGSKVVYESLTDGTYEGKDILENILYPILFNGFDEPYKNRSCCIYGTIWKYMVSRELIFDNDLRFKRFIDFEDDLIMSVELLLKAKSVSAVSEMLYFWRVNYESESSKKSYIKDLEARMKKLDAYIETMLLDYGIDKIVLDEYKRINNCNNYVRMILNESNCGNKHFDKRNKIKKYLIQTSYRENLKACNKIEKGHIKSKVLLNLLRYNMLSTALYAAGLLEILNRAVLKANILMKIERKIKGY